MSDIELRDRFAEIAFAETMKLAAPMLLGDKGDKSLSDIFRAVGVASYKFADSAMKARSDVIDGVLTK